MTTDEIAEALQIAADHFLEPTEVEDEDAELEKVVRTIRAKSVDALRWGRENDMRLYDELVDILERHEHRR